jgi:hypothetical protein
MFVCGFVLRSDSMKAVPLSHDSLAVFESPKRKRNTLHQLKIATNAQQAWKAIDWTMGLLILPRYPPFCSLAPSRDARALMAAQFRILGADGLIKPCVLISSARRGLTQPMWLFHCPEGMSSALRGCPVHPRPLWFLNSNEINVTC